MEVVTMEKKAFDLMMARYDALVIHFHCFSTYTH